MRPKWNRNNRSSMIPGGHESFHQNSVLSGLPAGSRVLVIRLRSMGDTILMTPALRLLHDWRPDLKTTVLVERPWNELLENHPAIDRVWVARARLAPHGI